MSSGADKSKNGGYDWIDCGAKIDFLYVSPDINVEIYETFADPRPGKKCYHSDHFPIVCDIKLPLLFTLFPFLIPHYPSLIPQKML